MASPDTHMDLLSLVEVSMCVCAGTICYTGDILNPELGHPKVCVALEAFVPYMPQERD